MRKEWTSKLPRATKVRLFRATVESVLLHGSETWTVTKKLEESVNGCYTRMMRTVLNVHWQQRMNNEELYGSLPRISETIRARRLRLPGHCGRHNEETASKVLLGNHNKVIQLLKTSAIDFGSFISTSSTGNLVGVEQDLDLRLTSCLIPFQTFLESDMFTWK